MRSLQLNNVEWLDHNGNRNYPLEDLATKTDVTGKRMEFDLLADLNIWFPNTYGKCAFITGMTITPGLLTLTIGVLSDRPYQTAVTPSFVPLAVVSVAKPIQPGLNYPMRAFKPGVGGWVSFNLAADDAEPANYQFTDPKATTILPRLARAYPIDGVTSVGKFGYSTELTGIINLVSSTPDRLIVEKRVENIDGIDRTAVVFRLNDVESGNEIYSQFTGPCGGVAESNSCPSPGIFSINGVTPDCSGVLTIHLKETVETGVGQPDLVVSYANTSSTGTEPVGTGTGHTVNLDYIRGIGSVCPPKPDLPLVDTDSSCDNTCVTCTPTGDPPADLTDILFTWHSGIRYEPGNERGDREFLKVSTPAEFDITRYKALKFFYEADDFLMLFPSTGALSFTQSPTASSYTPGSAVTVNIPYSWAIPFTPNRGYVYNKEIIDDHQYHRASVAKSVVNPHGTKTFAVGDTGNHGTTYASPYCIPNTNTFTVSSGGSINITSFDNGSGFLDATKTKFRVQAAHLVCGSGYGYVRIEGVRKDPVSTPNTDASVICDPTP